MLLTLTQAGKKKTKDIRARGADSSFLISIAEAGPSSIEDVASDLRIPVKTAQKLATKLAKAGLIRREE